jgi:hypothetical protein
MEHVLHLSQPALVPAADHLLDLVDQVLERHLNKACVKAIEGYRHSVNLYSEAGQQTALHHA